ncbi:MAG: chorismate mutase [Dehalococcoidia bacterium]|nr:chorismate mutase [Dehalococcoidia bacterium]MDH4299734.1 chorismate mutase [Dehalococcoidia bacterium]MDH4366999.1 chorismate mutase [Dehalococcoidia bacterium]
MPKSEKRGVKLQCRGIRGAITVSANNRKGILAAAKNLLTKMAKANSIETEDIAAILFTTTSDLNAEFPAAATRELGWPSSLALLCGHEMNVDGALPRCLRVLMLVNTTKRSDEIVHVYLGGAKKLKDKPSPAIGGKT